MVRFRAKEKVLAYILRYKKECPELLVFLHRDFPSAGWQVPAGTLEREEKPHNGVLREVKEESGLSGFDEVALLGIQEWAHQGRKELHHRHVFQLSYSRPCPDYFSHIVRGKGGDAGMVFLYQWVALDEVPELAADQGKWLDRLLYRH